MDTPADCIFEMLRSKTVRKHQENVCSVDNHILFGGKRRQAPPSLQHTVLRMAKKPCQVCVVVHKLPNFSVLSITSHKWGYTTMPAPAGSFEVMKLHL